MDLPSLSTRILSVFDKPSAQNKRKSTSIASNHLKIIKLTIIIDRQKLFIHLSTHWCRVRSDSAKYCTTNRLSACVQLPVGVRRAAGR